jgi:RNA polymerase sigma factor (sigma-70 family)
VWDKVKEMLMSSNEKKVAQLVLAHQAFVRALAFKLAPWPGLADDISQQVFFEFLAKQEKWDLEQDLRPLLATMTRHVAARCWRQRKHTMPDVMRELAEYVRELAEERAAPAYDDDRMAALRNCMEKLPDKGRTLLTLYYDADISTVDIAAQMGMHPDAVCQALCRLRGKLRDCIDRSLSKGGVHAGIN